MNKSLTIAACLLLLSGPSYAGSGAFQTPAPTTAWSEEGEALLPEIGRGFARLCREAKPAVVRVVTEDGRSGSGFIIDKRGYALTNAGVVGRFDRFKVAAADGSVVYGDLAAVQPARDLALIRLESRREDWPALELRDAPATEGEVVVAMGYPIGRHPDGRPEPLGFSASLGIVSGINRTFPSYERDVSPEDVPAYVRRNPPHSLFTRVGVAVTYLQSDAAINPGSFGGPLIDGEGKVIGVNTRIMSPTRKSNGLGFSINAEDVKAFLEEYSHAL